MLKSTTMALTDNEKRWLPWFGKTGKLAMRWATHVNRYRYAWLETAFDGIAETRVRILTDWTQQQWAHLEGFDRALSSDGLPDNAWLAARLRICRECTELFFIDEKGRVACSSDRAHIG